MSVFKKIMIVDDNVATNFLHKRLIEKSQLTEEVLLFKNGKDGLDFFLNAKEKPELILLDLNMPIMNGFEFLGNLKSMLSEDQKEETHIVIISSSNEAWDEERCKSLYNNLSYKEKPLNLAAINSLAGI